MRGFATLKDQLSVTDARFGERSATPHPALRATFSRKGRRSGPTLTVIYGDQRSKLHLRRNHPNHPNHR